jgi:ADP-ribose pyrophosphatase
MQIERPFPKQISPLNLSPVFRGKIFDVYQWEQKLYDGTSATFERIKRKDTVSVYPVTADKKIILTRQEQPGLKPFIGSLGGVIEINETPLQAAKREMLEESGYEAGRFELLTAEQPLDKIDWVIYTYIAKDIRKAQAPNPDAGEKITLLEVSFEEFLQIILQDNFRDKETTLQILLAKEKGELAKLREKFVG